MLIIPRSSDAGMSTGLKGQSPALAQRTCSGEIYLVEALICSVCTVLEALICSVCTVEAGGSKYLICSVCTVAN